MRVLFLKADPITAEVRIIPLLDALSAAGRIEGYAVVNRDMALERGRLSNYHAVLTHRNPSGRQIAWLRKNATRFVYDIDDLLTSAAFALTRKKKHDLEKMKWCIANAYRITSPSMRLLTVILTQLSLSLETRGIILPNSGQETIPKPKPASKPRLLWVSSDTPRFSPGEFDEICRGIVSGVRETGIESLLLGRFPEKIRSALGAQEQIPWMPFDSYRRLLANQSLIAVAPLSIDLPIDEQIATECKSDVKVAEFGSSRIDAAYSPATPYTETELPCTIVPQNTFCDWRNAVLQLVGNFPEAGNRLGEDKAFTARRPSVIALRLLDCLEAARINVPVRYRAIATPRLGRILERRVRKLRLRVTGFWAAR